MTDKHIRNILIALIRITLGKQSSLGERLNVQEWKQVADYALKQSVMGVLMPAIEQLDARRELPLGIYSLWSITAESLRERSAVMKDCAASLYAETVADGHRCCVLKGAGLAALYPEPSLRQSGDVDIWVEGGIQVILPYLRSKYKVRGIYYHHCEARVSKDVPVEVHFTPTWFNSIVRNKRLQKWFASEADRQFGNFKPELGFAVPDLTFNAVHSIIHILRHFLFEGVGLRQVMDCYFIMEALSDEERREVLAKVQQFGIGRFCAALMDILGEVFGLEREKMLCEPDARLGGRLLDEVLLAGNFGNMDTRNKVSRGDSLLRVAWLRLSSLTRYFVFCPSEILWAPAFKVWQYFWKKRY